MHYEEEGDRFYSKHNPNASSIYNQVLYYVKEKLVLENLRENQAILDRDIPVTIVDYGCADAKALLEILPDLSELLFDGNSERDINVIFNDTPDNDFKSVLKNIAEYDKEIVFEDQKNGPGTYFSAVSQSFYKQCVPNRVVSLGLCITAAHWLSKKPLNINNILIELSSDEEAKVKFARQAEEDWEQFLLMRANELHEGGYLVVFVPSIDRSGRIQVFRHTDTNKKHPMALLGDEWKKLLDDGVIDDREMKRGSLPIHLRNVYDITKPFDESQSKVIKSGLKLVTHDQFILEDPIFKAYGGSEGFPELYSEKVMLTLKSVFYGCFYSALAHSRSEEEKKSIMENYFDNFRKSLKEDVDNYKMDIIYCCMIIQKV